MRKRVLLSLIYLSWVAYAGGLAYLALRGHWAIGLAWLVGVPLMQWVYRELPTLTPAGDVAGRSDVIIEPFPKPGCMCCSVMEQRIDDLRKQLGV
jgi:hypothetical protein